MTIVEVGPGRWPVFWYSREVNKKVAAGSTYIGIDVNIKPLKEEITSIQKRNKVVKMHAISGDLGSIPLRDNVADQIWLLHVLGGNLSNRPLNESGFHRYFTELARILKPSGTLFIGEWVPRVRELDWLMEVDYNPYGLSKKIYKETTLPEFAAQYGIRFGIIWKDTPPFFITLTKVPPLSVQSTLIRTVHPPGGNVLTPLLI